MAMGLEHCLMITYGSAKSLFSWGRNHMGQLGLGNTEDVYEPTHIVGIVDAVKVSAGEDHSAVILETGEFYTWGLAECGKLGHGSGMKSGTQNYPRRVRTDEQLKSVACGAQHTAVLTSRGHLFTFGAGWYGRLGHGDMDNQYSLKLVEAISHRKIIDVQCGAYHTCIVTADRRLWQCGRDWIVCADDHVTTPQMLKKDIFVKMLAVGAQHTLCISDKDQLWGWGDNSKGQLGLDGGATRVLQPATVTHEQLAPETIQSVQVGYAHSMALLQNGEILSWGLRSGGRLGLARKSEPGEGKISPVPDYVDSLWNDNIVKKVRTKTVDAAEGGAEGALEALLPSKKTKTDIFGFMQKQLREEDHNNREEFLRIQETRMHDVYSGIIDDIFHLWDPPVEDVDVHGRSHDVPREYTLRHLQAKLDRSLCKNLKSMGLGDVYPSIQASVHPEIAAKLGPYEELLQVLQQHPCYLAKLAQHISIVETTTISLHPIKASVAPTMFMSVIVRLFASMRDNRVRHLFMAMMRQLIKYEIKVAYEHTHIKEIMLFDPKSSKVTALFKFFMKHGQCARLHSKLFDVDNPESLLAIILDWTVPVQSAALTNKASSSAAGKPAGSTDDEVLFVLAEQDLLQFTQAGQKNNLNEKDKEELLNNMMEEYQMHENNFLVFLGVGTHAGEKTERSSSKGRSKRPKLKTLGDFLAKLNFEQDVKSVWGAIRREMMKWLTDEAAIMRMVENFMANPGGEEHQAEDPAKAPEMYAPIMTLFLAGLLSPLLQEHEEVMTARMKRCLMECLHDRMQKKRGPDATQQEVEKDVAMARKKVSFNLRQLGTFMLRILLNDWNVAEQKLKKTAEFVRDKLVFPFVSSAARQCEDKTESDLTLDLFESHYTIKDISVQMGTSELLQLSNALWLFAEDIVDTDKELGPKEEQIKEDKLYQALDKVQPLPSEQDHDLEGRALKAKRFWPSGMLYLAHNNSFTHNFTINPRFLQHDKNLCYCMYCQAPIARSMAPVVQKRRQGLRLVRPYRERTGVMIDGKQPFADLVRLFVQKDLPVLKSRDFIGLKVELEDCQKNAQDRIDRSTANKAAAQREYALIAEIEKAKQATDLLRTNSVRPAQLVEYIFRGLEDRDEQRKYLTMIDNSSDKIEKVQKTYKDNLKVTIDALKLVVKASEESSVPIEFKLKAQETGVTLKLMRLERINRRMAMKSDGSEKYLPAATLTLGFLRAKKVVAWVKPDLPQKEYRRIHFNFTAEVTGNWNIVVLHKEGRTAQALFTFEVTTADIERMQSAAKTAKFRYNNGWVILNAFNLLQLLARITADAC